MLVCRDGLRECDSDVLGDGRVAAQSEVDQGTEGSVDFEAASAWEQLRVVKEGAVHGAESSEDFLQHYMGARGGE